MKKHYLITIMLCLSLMVSSGLMATNYIVSGAGTAAVNGTYVENGTINSQPKYEFVNGATTYYLFYYGMGAAWQIHTSTTIYGNYMSHYYCSSYSSTPPLTGWVKGATSGSTDPAPTLSETGVYSGGSGTEGAPYQIATTADLIELSNTSGDWVTGTYFIQTADIDFGEDETVVDWDGDGTGDWDANDQLGFNPIARTGYFKGEYDGDGYKISNLYINRPTQDNIGLFGWIFNGSVIKNVGVENVAITGRNSIGGLAGRATSSSDPGYASIINCYTTGTLTGVPVPMMGSWMYGSGIGGLLGYNDCDLSGKQNYIQNSYSTADVYDGISSIGGLVGKCVEINISNCYSTGNVTRKATATGVQFGGFCGFVNQYTTITNCYSTGSVFYADAAAPTDKGFIGADLSHPATCTANFFDSDASNQSSATGATGKTTAEMKTQSTFTNAGWDFTESTGDWSINSVDNDGFPYLQWQTFDPVIVAPTAQPTNLAFSNEVNTTPDPDENNILLSWTASASASSYLVVRNIGSAPTFTPSDGTEYTAGSQSGGTVVYSGTATSATDTDVSEGSYYYELFAFNGSGSTTKYLTTNPLSGNIIISTDGTTTLSNSGSEPVSAGFPNKGINITFPDGTTGTELTANRIASAPSANFQGNAGVRGMSPLYFTVTSSNATPGNYTIVLDFSSLGLTEAKWNRFKVMKRADASSYWKDITGAPHNATIVSRQTDGVWGKFTISGLSSFSEFGGGEGAYTVTSSADDGANTLRGIITDIAVGDGDVIEFDVVTMGTNTITLLTTLEIDKNLTLVALGSDGGIILDGGDAVRVLDIADTKIVTLRNLKIQNGFDDTDYAGGIWNNGDLTMINCVVSDNKETNSSLGVGGILQFSDTEDDENDVLTLINSTITANDGTNSGAGGAGGLMSVTGTVTLRNTIIYGNVGDTDNDVDASTTLDECNNSCIGNLNDLTITSGSGNISGNPNFQGSTINATHPYAILGVSPCADEGDNSYCTETYDIRGFDRKLDKNDYTQAGIIDMGAYEFKEGTDPNNVLSWTGAISTAWETAGNWNAAAFPVTGDLVTIPGSLSNYPVIGTSVGASCNNLTISNGASLRIESTIDGTGSLIIEGTLTNNGTMTAQRYITGSSNDWHLLSSPVSAQEISGNFTDANGYDFYLYNEPTVEWINRKNLSGGSGVAPYFDVINGDLYFTPGKGYLVAYTDPNANAKSFSGTFNQGNQSIVLTKTDGVSSSGANLVGNPYPSSIDWKAASGWTRDMLVDDDPGEGTGYTMYIWNEASNNYGAFISNGSSGSLGVTQYIPPMQGFFVNAASAGLLQMTNAVRTHSGADNWMKQQETTSTVLKMQVTHPDLGRDEAIVEFSDTHSGGAPKWHSLEPTAPSLWISEAQKDYSILFSPETRTEPLALHFQAGNEGTYNLSVEADNLQFKQLMLEDLQLGLTQDLLKNNQYTFTADPSDASARFNIHFSVVGLEENPIKDDVLVWKQNNLLYLKGAENYHEAGLFDLQGRLLQRTTLSGDDLQTMPSPGKTGMYLIRLLGENHTVSKKLIIK
ncbi:MAG: T9SS type A sorting domain-containing protein [Bacteroidales bacterium]|nr:T9SS type A sorting domain-containing protein [Bacteroidales bacterium]